jgi:hypothetical protein
MNLELIAAIAAKNSADVEAIISTVGVANALKLWPHIQNILATVQAEQAKAKPAAS